MRVTFDSNVWQKVVSPERFPNDPQKDAAKTIREALENKRIQGFISETVATLEAVPRAERSKYLSTRADDAIKISSTSSEGGRIRFTIEVGGFRDSHPGLKPVLADRLKAARQLGIKLLPSSRIGTVRPPELDIPDINIPLTAHQEKNILEFMQKLSDIGDDIENRNVGRKTIENIALRIQQREGLSGAWYDGLNQPRDRQEEKQIEDAYAEWSDGDSVASHIGYEIDVFCTEDMGKSAGKSILNPENRSWLVEAYGVRFMNAQELASELRAET